MEGQVIGAIAHVRRADELWVSDALESHLRDVLKLAAGFAKVYAGKEFAAVADPWQGKCAPDFQSNVRRHA